MAQHSVVETKSLFAATYALSSIACIASIVLLVHSLTILSKAGGMSGDDVPGLLTRVVLFGSVLFSALFATRSATLVCKFTRAMSSRCGSMSDELHSMLFDHACQ